MKLYFDVFGSAKKIRLGVHLEEGGDTGEETGNKGRNADDGVGESARSAAVRGGSGRGGRRSGPGGRSGGSGAVKGLSASTNLCKGTYAAEEAEEEEEAAAELASEED